VQPQYVVAIYDEDGLLRRSTTAFDVDASRASLDLHHPHAGIVQDRRLREADSRCVWDSYAAILAACRDARLFLIGDPERRFNRASILGTGQRLSR
jgi:hypothetical protein